MPKSDKKAKAKAGKKSAGKKPMSLRDLANHDDTDSEEDEDFEDEEDSDDVSSEEEEEEEEEMPEKKKRKKRKEKTARSYFFEVGMHTYSSCIFPSWDTSSLFRFLSHVVSSILSLKSLIFSSLLFSRMKPLRMETIVMRWMISVMRRSWDRTKRRRQRTWPRSLRIIGELLSIQETNQLQKSCKYIEHCVEIISLM
tara:strand:+ start:114 stop:704 length:591 start_codon:yes stop_codon:yes gene_type:complete